MKNKANDFLRDVLSCSRSNLTFELVHDIGHYLIEEGYSAASFSVKEKPPEEITKFCSNCSKLLRHLSLNKFTLE